MNRRLWMLTFLYVAQGLPFGFFTQALPVRMRESGMSLGAIGLTSLLAAPWALKAFFAPLVDAHGSRRAWIVPLQLGSVAVLVVASFLPPERALVPVLVAVLVSNALAAAQDVATDALAVDVLAPSERGLGNGIQVAGYRVGMILGGGALLVVLGTIGWGWALRLLALGTALTTLPLLAVREERRERARVNLRAIFEATRRPNALGWLALLLVYKAGDALATAMLRPMLVDSGYGAAQVGILLGQVGFGAGLAGALLGGLLVPKLGRGRALVLYGTLQAVGIGAYAFSGLPLGLVIGFEHLAGGMATAALFTCMMDACRSGFEATDYALQASLVVIATGVGAALSGLIAEALGYAGCFTLAALVSSVGVVLAESLRRRRALVPQEAYT